MSASPDKERPLHWIGSAKHDLLEFPDNVIDDFGYGLGVVQLGGQPPSAKPWKGEGQGVFELVEDHRADTYRVAYTVRFSKAVYVLHCFQNKVAFRRPYRQDRHRPDPAASQAGPK